jgi:hypothetical protein
MNAREDWIVLDLQWTRERLRNWGRWSRDRLVVARCFSAEGRYRPERLTSDEEADRRAARGTEPDVADALLVWRAIMPTHGMPRSLAYPLHGHYALRLRGESLRHWLRRRGIVVRGRDLDNLVHEAELAAHNRLRRVDRAAVNRV